MAEGEGAKTPMSRILSFLLSFVFLLAGLGSLMSAKPINESGPSPIPSRDSVVAAAFGAPIRFDALDQASEGSLSDAFALLDEVLAEAIREGCRRWSEEAIADTQGQSRLEWREQLWASSVPHSDAVASFIRSIRKGLPGSEPNAEYVYHLISYKAFQESLAAQVSTAEFEQTGIYARAIADPDNQLVDCNGRPVSGAIALDWAGPELVRKRYLADQKICQVLDAGAGDKLLLAAHAERSGVVLEELVASARSKAPEATRDEVHEMAENRLGALNDANWAEAEERLADRNEKREERTLIEEIRRSARPRCLWSRREPRAIQPARKELRYYGTTNCTLCTPGYAMASRLRKRLEGRGIDVVWVNHLDPSFTPQFVDSVAVECARRQNKTWDYIHARMGEELSRGDAGDRAGLDQQAFSDCRASASAIIAVLEAVETAKALGLGGAIPSWTIDGQPLRGWQSEETLNELLGLEPIETVP